MTSACEPHLRRSIRLQTYDYSQAGAYFVTLCTLERRNTLGKIVDERVKLSAHGDIVLAMWQALPQRFDGLELDEYVVMPNHVHGILLMRDLVAGIEPCGVGAIHESPVVGATTEPPGVGAIPRLNSGETLHELPLQSQVDRRRMLLPKIIGYFKMNSAKAINALRHTPGQAFWQRNYYERVVRNDRELVAIQQYIQDNPLKWQLDRENPDGVQPRGR